MSDRFKTVQISFDSLIQKNDISNVAPSFKKFAPNVKVGDDVLMMNEDPNKYVPGAIPLILNEETKDMLEQLKQERELLQKRKSIVKKRNAHASREGGLSEPEKPGSQATKDKSVTENDQDSEQLNAAAEPDSHFMVLSDFLSIVSKTVSDQILTIAITDMPNYKDQVIEQLLRFIIVDTLSQQLDASPLKVSYKWSSSGLDNSDSKTVYVKFELLTSGGKPCANFINLDKDKDSKLNFLRKVFVPCVKVFHGLELPFSYRDEYNRMMFSIAKTSVSYESNTKTLISIAQNEAEVVDGKLKYTDKTIPDGDTDDVELQRLREDSKLLAKSLSKRYGEDKEISGNLDEDYHVNLKELSDLPKKLIPQIADDIKKFRTSIIRLEKRKQAKRLNEEKKKAKMEIKKMYKAIKDAQSGKKGQDYAMDEDDDEDDGEGDASDVEELSDSEFEEQAIEESKRQRHKEYLRLEATMKRMESVNKQSLFATLESSKNYEENLDKNKDLLLNDYETLFGDESILPHTVPESKIHDKQLLKLAKMYKNNRTLYFQMRNRIKEQEEKKDSLVLQ